MIDHRLVDPVDELDHADDAEAAEEAERAAYSSNLVNKGDLNVPLHVGHGWLCDLDGNLGNVPLHLDGNSILPI